VCLPDDAGSFNLPVYTPGAHSNSPLTINGNSFNCGWQASGLDGARNRSTGVDARCAGRQGALNTGTYTFTIQAGTAAGQYKFWIACCDIGNGTTTAPTMTLNDANGLLATITGSAALTANQVMGADGTIYTNAAAWAATTDTSGVSITVNSTDTSNGNGGPLFNFTTTNTYSPLAHVAIQYIAAAGAGQPLPMLYPRRSLIFPI
jgi:hypothetical protein